MPVFSRFSVSPSSTIGPATRASATAPYEARHVQALLISDKVKTTESSLSNARAASTTDSDTDGDASGGSPLGGSRSNAFDATNSKEHASSHSSSSLNTVPRDERRVPARASEGVDTSSHLAATPAVATTEPWSFGLLDEDALDAAAKEVAPIGKGCGSDGLAARKAKHAAGRRFPQRSLWTPPAHFLPPVDEFCVPHSASMAEWPTVSVVNNIAPPKEGCGSDDLAARKAQHAAERRFPQRSLWTPPAHFLPPLDEFWVPWSSMMAEWSILSSPPHSCAPALAQSEDDDGDDSDKENQAPARDLGTFVPARRRASRHLSHRRVLSSLTAGSNTARNTYLDASTTVASPSVLPFALLKEKVLVSDVL